MAKYLDPKLYGLHAKTVVEEIDEETIALVLHRKSRIIMSDGKKIVEKIIKIKKYEPKKTFCLKTTGPVCSKTRSYLENEGIRILPENI